MNCSNNHLTSLPELPNDTYYSGFQTINCSNNKLTSLPTLPHKLGSLCCSNNQLTSLPTLNYSLYSLDCSNNQITYFPSIEICATNQTSCLNFLNCSNNQLTSLPYIHKNSRMQVICINNKLDFTNLPDDYFTIHFKPSITPIKEEEPIIKKEEPIIKEEEPIPNKKNMRIINKFKHLYYSLKFKKHFIKLLKKSRERKTNKTNRIIIAIVLIILVIVVIKIIIMMSRIMFGKHELSNNQLPYSRYDSYELIKDKQIKQICITPSQTEPIQYIF